MQEGLNGYNAAPSLPGRRLLRERRAMAALAHGGGGPEKKNEVVEERKGEENTVANKAHVHGGEKTVEVTVVGLSGESSGKKNEGSKRKFAGQVPLSSDYRIPKCHPPRNN